MSIFTKQCPACTASHSAEVARCGCGYSFGPEKSESVTQELQGIYHEEKLYRDYLAARIGEVEKEAQAARAAAAYDPGNAAKMAAAELAEQAAASARAELEAQTERARAVKNRLKVFRGNRREKKPEVSAGNAAAPIREMPVPKKKPVVATPPPPPKQASPPPRPVVNNVKPAAGATHAKARTAIESRAQVVPAPKARAMPGAANTGSAGGQQRVTPARAKHVGPTQHGTPHPKTAPVRVPPQQSTRPSGEAAPPARPSKSATQECPNCMAKVPINAARCGCGFEMMSHASEMPALSMSPEDRAAFLAALNPRRK